MKRFWHLVQLQLAELLHQRVGWLLAGAAVALVLSCGALRDFNFGGAEARFFTHVAQVGLLGGGTLAAALLGPALVGQGLAQRTAQALFARGVRRGEWLLASLVALWVALGWFLILLGGALAFLLVQHGHDGAIRAAVTALAAEGGALLLIGAAAILFAAVFERTPPAAAATVAFALAGQLAPIVAHLAARASGASALGWRALDLVVPSFALVEQGSFSAAAYLLGYAAVLAGAAVLVFSRREL